ncbi:hypothetical protein ACET3X_005952 [Alternaria dauci]|uniref:RSE1/DDB1/CPSF1 first beta-propeller domain-containing protein n=1 Tax=Alternaria dauci TaxID=48095 RepID=A0ABR3UGW7_9PLEO
MAQAQGLSLVDGEWVSRPLDPYQIMANAPREHVELRDATTRPSGQVPEYGILSQTVVETPLSKLILPAKIRHKDLTDIVMVGEDSIHLKEIRHYGRIHHVASKANFNGGRILTAKVFGNPRELPATKGAGLPSHKNYMKHVATKSAIGEDGNMLPPEVVVLSLSNRSLITVRLPAGNSRSDRLGTFLAVDPKCRAIAVAAHEGRFILYKTKPMDKWTRQARESNEITAPIEDERIISIEGQIMHMDFLSSGGGHDDYHVVLLFVVVLQGKTRLTCFDWDCRQDLSRATPRTERYLVQFEDMMPSLLIPLRHSPDFLLVSDDHISVYKNVLSGDPAHMIVPIHQTILHSVLPGDSKNAPKWTAWDKTPRNPEYQKEAFYVTREDGRIIYVVRDPSGTVEIDEAGEWQCRVDTAFSCLSLDYPDISQQYPDLLIAGGASNDSLLCKVGNWPAGYPYALRYPDTNQFSIVDTIPNWTPLTDLAVTQLSSPRAPDERQRSSIFVTNGNRPNGEISELRRGIQAVVDDSFSGINGCTGIWVLDHGSHMVEIEGTMTSQHYAIFAITLPPETLVIRVVRTQPESRADFSGAWEQGSWDKFQTPSDDDPLEDDLMREMETISACPWSDKISIQITRQEVRTLLRPTLKQIESLAFDASLLLAASLAGCPFIVIALRESGCALLEIVPISKSGNFERSKSFRHRLDHDPTCIEILDIDGFPYVFVSTFDSKILLFKYLDDGTSIALEDSWTEYQTFQNLQNLCESAVVLKKEEKHLLVCAMRDGTLLTSHLHVDNSGISSLSWNAVQMGTASAKITRSETNVSAAYVSCGSDFCRVRYSPSGLSHLGIDSIWFTDRTHPEYDQSPVSALFQLPFLPEQHVFGRNLGGFLFAVAGDRLLFSQLDADVQRSIQDVPAASPHDTKIVPRKLLVGAKPTNVLFMKKLRRVLVSTMEAKERRGPPLGERILQSSMKLLKIRDDRPSDDMEIKQEMDTPAERLVVAQCPLMNAERVYSVVEWQFVNKDTRKYNLIIVGTGIQTSATQHNGRRLIFNTGKSGSKLDLQKQSTYNEPVYGIALWDNQTTVSIIGRSLFIDHFDEDAGRWFQRGKTDLHSPGIHVSVIRPFVYVSTLQHSHLCYKVVEAARPGTFEFVREFSDSGMRNCARHLVVDLPSTKEDSSDRFVLVTDKKGSSVTGLYQPPVPTYSNASPTLFEACLPRTVIRLDRGDIRPPWRRAAGQITGIVVDDIIGACTDGTIFTFSILAQPARLLLRLIQNLIEIKATRSGAHKYDAINPHSGDIFNVLMNNTAGNQHGELSVRDVDPRHLWQSSKRGPKHKHVDGDLLQNWLHEEGDLEFLVRNNADAEIIGLFEELALDVDQSWGGRDRGKGIDQHENRRLCEHVKRWMSEVLMPVL